MPGNPTIDLDVQPGASPNSGYTDTTASDGAPYCYRYSGGGGKGGDVTCTVGNGVVMIVVVLKGDRRFTIDTVGFTGDNNDQLSLVSSPHGHTSATIKNLNTVVQAANYKVTVTDSTMNCTIPCDPQIINKST